MRPRHVLPPPLPLGEGRGEGAPVQMICHAVFQGPFVTGSDPDAAAHAKLLAALAEKCAPLREARWRTHRLAARYDFHLRGERLKRNDLAAMAREVQAAAFGEGSAPSATPFWQLEARKLVAEEEDTQRTVVWFFDLGGR